MPGPLMVRHVPDQAWRRLVGRSWLGFGEIQNNQRKINPENMFGKILYVRILIQLFDVL